MLLIVRIGLEDKLKGLEFLDDYVIKFFYFDELVVWVEVLLRRFDKIVIYELKLKYLSIYLKEKRILNN